MLTQLENLNRLSSVTDKGLQARDKFADEAIALLTSGAMEKAMNLDEERDELREKYGANIYGQRVLLGRRLIEAGARFVTINQAVQGGLFGNGITNGTWDNHHLLFESMMSFGAPPPNIPNGYKWHSYKGPGNLPQLDMSLAALLDDLEERGLLDSTLVVAMGEFGRTPKINKYAGRDHYPSAGNVLMAGAGVQRGTVIGATDRSGAEPKSRPWHPEDFSVTWPGTKIQRTLCLIADPFSPDRGTSLVNRIDRDRFGRGLGWGGFRFVGHRRRLGAEADFAA